MNDTKPPGTTSKSKLLNRTEIVIKYGITKGQMNQLVKTGYIGPVKGFPTTKVGHSRLASEDQINKYFQRRVLWNETFYNVARMSEFVGMRSAGKRMDENSDVRQMMIKGHHVQIQAPRPYHFKYMNKVYYWHIDDLTIFRRFIERRMAHELETIGNPVFNADTQLWEPTYPMPMSEWFTEALTEETIRQSTFLPTSHEPEQE